MKKVFNYLEYLALSKMNLNTTLFKEADDLRLKIFPDIEINSRFSPVFFVLDYITKAYTYVHKASENITGYKTSYFLDGGLESFIGIMMKEDFEIFCNKVFVENIKIIGNLRPGQSMDYVFTHTVHLKTKEGKVINVAQRYSYILSDAGLPLGVMGFIIDVTHLNNNDKVQHTVEKLDTANNTKKLILNKTYSNNEAILSKREIEVLKWICEGLNSKQIAEKLFISINTVNNHRKNMMAKTNSQNGFELLSFAIKNGLL